MPGTAGLPSSGIFRPCCPSKSRPCHDPRRAPGTSAEAGARPGRGEARRRGSGHAALGPRRARGPLSDAARDDPRPRHATAPTVREVLRLRGGSVPRTAGRPAARRGRDGGRALSGRGGHGRRLAVTHPESIGRDGTLADQAMARTSAPAALGEDRRRGHDPSGQSSDHEHDHDDAHAFAWPEALRMGLVALAAAAVWFRVWEPYRSVSVIGAVGLAIGAWPIFKEAFANLIERRMTMELSMTIAIVAAAGIGEFFTALVITLFVLVAEVLEGMTVQRGRRAIRDLLEFLPREVSVRRAGSVRAVSADELGIGDAILVNPGGRVPVDGTVLAGHSFVDESRITGESMPVEKTNGAPVYAGSINQSGALEVRTERIGRDTSYGKIIEAVQRAQRPRAPAPRLAGGRRGLLGFLAAPPAAVTFSMTRDLRSTISVVIVAGACGIAAGTPLALLGGVGRAARLGAIIKGGLYLEILGRVNTVVLDKTGTLTLGRMEVQAVLPAVGSSEFEVIANAASAEMRSEHPLGKAIVARALAAGLPVHEPERFAYTPGRGISAVVDGSTILVGNSALM